MASNYEALSQQQMQYNEIIKAIHTVGSEHGECQKVAIFFLT